MKDEPRWTSQTGFHECEIDRKTLGKRLRELTLQAVFVDRALLRAEPQRSPWKHRTRL